MHIKVSGVLLDNLTKSSHEYKILDSIRLTANIEHLE